jgi:hypothetical protein
MAVIDILSQLPAPFSALPAWGLVVLAVWTIVWKGIALWKSARLSQPLWFVLLLIINTLGILEILYIFIFSRLSFNHLSARKKARKK